MSEQNNNTPITIADLEAIAQQIETEDRAERERLHRLISAYARIVAIREPEAFRRQAVEYSDEEGHFDNSYPPDQEWKDFSGPRALCVKGESWDEVSTSSGFYYDWRAAGKDSGLYIAPDGAMLGAEVEGQGHFGQFAAHPGDCHVRITLRFCNLEEGNVTMERLQLAESTLRDKAFPHVAAARQRKVE